MLQNLESAKEMSFELRNIDISDMHTGISSVKCLKWLTWQVSWQYFQINSDDNLTTWRHYIP